ncbi:MAG: PAS domain-containing protein [Nitrospirae bacterium]|nr:PAS domain-containing protein [Nitrospirota bacterium]
MLQELILILTQFGGGPGDPANNVVRFLLATFFWVVLLLVSSLMWRTTADRRHLYFSISAAVGASRELFMFTAEYGSFRGYISFPTIFRYYPPLEHAVAILSIILMGYAFLRFYFSFERFSRFFLICSSLLTLAVYIVIAPLWVRFLDATARASLNSDLFIGAAFHDFSGDLVFRLLGAFVCFLILNSFLYSKTRSIKFPWLAFIAFFFFFMDDALQAVNDLHNDRYAPVFAPLRHCLHIAAIALLVGVYWWEITRQLKGKQQFLQSMLDTIPDMLFYKDVQGVYLGCNQNYASSIIGKPQEEIIGFTDRDFEPDPALVEIIRRTDLECISTQMSCSYERLRTLQDGRQAILETIKTPFHDDEGKAGGLIGVSRDITERRRLEEQLRHSQKMEVIGQLAGGVAHDFNNILSVITGYSELTLMRIEKNDPLRLNIEKMHAAADRAARLTKSLLTFSRKQPLNLRVFDLNPILHNFEKFLKRIIGEDICLNIALADEPLTVSADSGQLEQIMMNLAANARDAMPGGGQLTMDLSRDTIGHAFIETHGYGTPGHYAVLTVSDTGEGMDEKTRQKIFEPYFTTKEIGKGTGLGLAIVYGIVKQHNGYIDVMSAPGDGTVFRVYIPISDSEVKYEGITSPDFHVTGGGTILVAEDDEDVRGVVLDALSKFDYDIIVAEDGQDAVERYKEHRDRIQLVLMDIVMPKLNGRDAARQIRQMHPKAKILFTSGYTADIIQARGELDEGEELIMKPVKPSELLRKMREMLDHG